ncbi:MAG: uracil-DNA glycosylase [Gammaproteobacteria bacterium]|nr:uracil-DNA glycosylase [Gammaproteobacteria bacterium]
MSEKKLQIKLEPSWKQRLAGEFEQSYMVNLRDFLVMRKQRGIHIYPHSKHWFRAFELTPFDAVKVVILGQDPYHGPGQAHGLCFSVAPGVAIPPSLQNIYKELETDTGFVRPAHGCLIPWARQGVFLLNSVLTVEQGHAASHQGRGWEQFTDRAVSLLSEERENLVFLLWGSYAQKKGQFIDRKKHQVLSAPHPSPLSAHRGFLGCGHFSRTNAYLGENGKTPVDWQLPQSFEDA